MVDGRSRIISPGLNAVTRETPVVNTPESAYAVPVPSNLTAGLETISIAGEVPVILPLADPTKASALILKASTVTLAVGIAPTEASKLYSLINPLPIPTIVFEAIGVVDEIEPTTS